MRKLVPLCVVTVLLFSAPGLAQANEVTSESTCITCVPLQYATGFGGSVVGFFGGAFTAYMAGVDFPTKDGPQFPAEEQGKVDFSKLGDATKITMLSAMTMGSVLGVEWWARRKNQKGKLWATTLGSTIGTLIAVSAIDNSKLDFSENGKVVPAVFLLSPLGALGGHLLTRETIPASSQMAISAGTRPPLSWRRIGLEYGVGTGLGILSFSVTGALVFSSSLLSWAASDGESSFNLSEESTMLLLLGASSLGTAFGIDWMGSRGNEHGSFWWTAIASAATTSLFYFASDIRSSAGDVEDDLVRMFLWSSTAGVVTYNLTRQYDDGVSSGLQSNSRKQVEFSSGSVFLKRLSTPEHSLVPMVSLAALTF